MYDPIERLMIKLQAPILISKKNQKKLNEFLMLEEAFNSMKKKMVHLEPALTVAQKKVNCSTI